MSYAIERRRFREIGERLNRIRQEWEITLQLYPSKPATMAEVNGLAGVLAELLHTLGYDQADEPPAGGRGQA